jgi:predicted MPP superfamily phosphohydrolase
MSKKLLSERLEKRNLKVTAEDCIMDLRLLQEHYPNSDISRNFYRCNGSYADSVWSKFFGTFHEFRRQSELVLTRHQHKLEKDIAKHASFDHYVKFFELEVLPYHNKYEKKFKPGHIKSIMVCSDLHDLDVNRFCWSVFVDTALRLQPDIIVFNGDIFDLYEFSNFDKDPRELKIKERFEFVKNTFFKQIREACPNAQIDFIMGNHEFRLLRHIADRSPNLRVLLSDVMDIGFAEIFGLDEYQINWISKLNFKAYSKEDIKKELKKNFKIYFDSYVISHEPDTGLKGVAGTNGHHHQVEMQSTYDLLRGPLTWVQTPGMHQLHAEYIGGAVRWNLGFLIVHINTSLKQVIQIPICVHEDWALVNGVYYKRN